MSTKYLPGHTPVMVTLPSGEKVEGIIEGEVRSGGQIVLYAYWLQAEYDVHGIDAPIYHAAPENLEKIPVW